MLLFYSIKIFIGNYSYIKISALPRKNCLAKPLSIVHIQIFDMSTIIIVDMSDVYHRFKYLCVCVYVTDIIHVL